MNNDCCWHSSWKKNHPEPVAAPCVYDLDFIFKAMANKTKITIQGVTGIISGIETTSADNGYRLSFCDRAGWVVVVAK
jgi:hypothetical protein